MAKRYPSPPAMQIDVNKSYTATFHTEKGNCVVDLFVKQAPITVSTFAFQVRA